MNKSILISAALCLALCVAGNVAQTAAQPIFREPVTIPAPTIVGVEVTAVRSEFTAGPYARWAQKYLGVAAPLADKITYEIASVKILKESDLAAELPVKSKARSEEISHIAPESGFPLVSVDRLSAAPRTAEESARVAAAKIFEIRKNRYELVSGQAGENVFGAGLKSALNELREMEEGYLSLFLGRQSVRTATKHYRIVPRRGADSYTVCRFSDDEGVVAGDDMRGRALVLELTPLDTPVDDLRIQAKASAKTIPLRLPAQVVCRVIFEGSELASNILEVNQLATIVNILP